jgi:dephospho-CoA kinase
MMAPPPLRLGLTGSIGMGKSTVAAMFAAEGVPVWDADATVHRLYAPGGAAVGPVSAAFPAALQDGGIARPALNAVLAGDDTALAQLEAIVHPLVAADRAAFLRDAQAGGAPLVVFDIPLLFETGAEADLDRTLVVTAPADLQRARVLARPGMTAERLDRILARQMPDAEKRRRADLVVESVDLGRTRAAIRDLVARLKKEREDA